MTWSGKLFGLLYVRFDKELFKNIITFGITNTEICQENGTIWLWEYQMNRHEHCAGGIMR